MEAGDESRLKEQRSRSQMDSDDGFRGSSSFHLFLVNLLTQGSL